MVGPIIKPGGSVAQVPAITPDLLWGPAVELGSVSGGGSSAIKALDVLVTVTTPVSIVSTAPTAPGAFLVMVYARVTVATTSLVLEVTWDDNGAQSYTWVNASEPVGTYTFLPVFAYADIAAAVTITATAGTADQVYVTGAILPL